jgi:hypothetical protein
MAKTINKIKKSGLILAIMLAATALIFSAPVIAEGENTEEAPAEEGGTTISISPVSNIISIEGNNTYEYSFKVTNGGNSEMKFEVYAAPYSYTLASPEKTTILKSLVGSLLLDLMAIIVRNQFSLQDQTNP